MIEINAPAKVNLCLFVGAPKAEQGAFFGYHEIDSLVAFTTECCDNLSFAKNSDIQLEIIGEFSAQLPVSNENLILRAACLLKDKFDIKVGAKILLEKNLPIASGIGGGSSDCAATIIGLNQLWALGLEIEQMQQIGLQIGADIPACIAKSALLMRGYGEKIENAPKFSDLPILLVNPLIGAMTQSVYAKYDELGVFSNVGNASYFDCPDFDTTIEMLCTLENNLENAAIKLVPQIGEILALLKTIDGAKLCRMSGSGATCFAIFETIEMAAAGRNAIIKYFEKTGQKIWAQAAILKGNYA